MTIVPQSVHQCSVVHDSDRERDTQGWLERARGSPPSIRLAMPPSYGLARASDSGDNAGDDAELRAAVTAALAERGVLDQIRANLRQHVFEALDTLTATTATARPARFEGTTEGKLFLDLFRDYLQHNGLHRTLSVLHVESGLDADGLTATVDRAAVARRLQLPSSASSSRQSLVHAWYVAHIAQTSRPHSPVIQSPRSEDRPLPTSRSPTSIFDKSELSPPMSPHRSFHSATPPRILSSPSRSPPVERSSSLDFALLEDERRLAELNRQLASLPVKEIEAERLDDSKHTANSTVYSEDFDSFEATIDLSNHTAIHRRSHSHDSDAWAKRYDAVEIARPVG